MSLRTLSAIFDIASELQSENVPGAWVECGTWNGGSAGVIGSVSKNARPARQIWLFDSWMGLPTPTDSDVATDGAVGEAGWASGERSSVEALLFNTLKLTPRRFHLAQGWFEDTIPASKDDIQAISYLLLDADWYESTRLALDCLFDLLVPGAWVVVDDYSYWGGVRKAVDEFFVARNVSFELHAIPPVAVAFRLQRPGDVNAMSETDGSD
jgi:O-methyltransferase